MLSTLITPEGVVVKNTRYGLLVSLREDLDFELALLQIREKLSDVSLLESEQVVSLDLGWRELSLESFSRLQESLGSVRLAGVLSTSLQTRTVVEGFGIKAIIGRLGLAHHQGRRLRQEQRESLPAVIEAPGLPVPEVVVAEPSAGAEEEQEATLYLKRNLRSGQKAVYPGNIVVWGDLNPGSELEAEGDVLVLGTVRGRIHAGCNGNQQAQIYCQALHPTVLRIADAIWTGELEETGLKRLPAAIKVCCVKDLLRFETQK